MRKYNFKYLPDISINNNSKKLILECYHSLPILFIKLYLKKIKF